MKKMVVLLTAAAILGLFQTKSFCADGTEDSQIVFEVVTIKEISPAASGGVNLVMENSRMVYLTGYRGPTQFYVGENVIYNEKRGELYKLKNSGQ